MRVYIAAQFARREEMQKYADELRRMDFEVTSRWLQESGVSNELKDYSKSYLLYNGHKDLVDIQKADALVFFTEDADKQPPRGGRHFESGYAYALGKKLITVGTPENIFHSLPDVINAPTWEDAKVVLLKFAIQASSGVQYLLPTSLVYNSGGAQCQR